MKRSRIKTLPDLDLPRTKPRSFAEWKTLRRWCELPVSEQSIPGYIMRMTREEAGLTQVELALRLKVTQQAVAQAERWQSNPTVGFMASWVEACGKKMDINISTPHAN
ncbi:MAG: helix-turn-helix transcriptional regulator [Pseudomonadota bacterium]|jgi:DNA-binding XRE family transcriptional regulator